MYAQGLFLYVRVRVYINKEGKANYTVYVSYVSLMRIKEKAEADLPVSAFKIKQNMKK